MGLPMNRLRLSPLAQDDLLEIKDYIERELLNPDAALKTVGEITHKLRLLEEHSDIGAPVSTSIRFATDERFLVCGKYIAFYHVLPGIVYIDRVLYGKRDYKNLLLGREKGQ